MANYLISRKSEGHASALEKCPKWVLHPYFFSGNMSKMIPGVLLKTTIPLMMDTGGGCMGSPPSSRPTACVSYEATTNITGAMLPNVRYYAVLPQ